jgi:hypothetical protein
MLRYLTRCLLLGAAFWLVLAGPSEGAKVKVWYHANQGHYDKAQFKQAVVTSEGALRLSRLVKPLAGIQATHVWAMVEDRAGNLFVATGGEGKLFKVSPDGKVALVYTSTDSQIVSLAVAPDGTVFAGTGPHGLIVSIPPVGAAKVLVSDLDNYVWSLVHDPVAKTLYAGTGPKGRIYQVSADGKASIFYATKQQHILCLARSADNMLYAGTDKGGLVYRIDPAGKGFVVFHAQQQEVHTLLLAGNEIYAGTSVPVPRGSRGSSPGSGSGSAVTANDRDGPDQASSKKTKPKKVAAKTVSSSNSADDDNNNSSRNSAASAAAPPATGENSIYKISPDGTVRELFRDKVMVLSLMRWNGKLLAGTGMRGQLFEIDEASKEKSELARLDNGLIHCLFQRKDGSIVIGAGDPGKLYVLDSEFSRKGTVTSGVLDAKIISKWGTLSWKAHTPAGTAVSIAVRTGNVSEPDQTWSDWSAEETDLTGVRVKAPAARYLQYRVTLSTDNTKVSPQLASLALRYKNTNQAPEITSLEVPDLANTNLENPKKLKIKWSAVDPNEDELTYNLYVRKDGWKDWVLLEDDLEKKEFEWDTTTFPSGFYQVKIVASDRRDNSPEEALSSQRISPVVPVSHVPPTVQVKVNGMDGDRAIIEATATDSMVRLTEASFAVNGKKWSNVFPTDGLFDSKTENFRFTTDSLRPGTYVLILRVKDAAGNVGSGDVVFTVRERQK